MNLKCETILDFYTHKNRKIFCQIRVLSSRSNKLKSTYRSLTSDQWNAFDKELEKILDNTKSLEDGNKENLGKFTIKPNIEVKVQKSNLSLKYFHKFLSINGNCEKDSLGNVEDVKDIAVVLECMLDLKNESEICSSKSVEPLHENILNYKPTSIRDNCSSKTDVKCANDVIIETDEENVPSPNYRLLRIKSMKNIPNEIDTRRIDKDTNDDFKEIGELSEILPASYNKDIKKRSKTVDSIPKELEIDNKKLKINSTLQEDKKTDHSDFESCKSQKEENETNGKERKCEKKAGDVLRPTSSEGEHFREKSKRAQKQTKTHSQESDNDFEDAIKEDNRNCLSSQELNATDDSRSAMLVQKGKNSEQPNTKSLRRSDRSPSKTKRFIQEICGAEPNQEKKPKKVKTSHKNKELFGSDDDDDEDDNKDFESIVDNSVSKKTITEKLFETPISKKHNNDKSSSASSGKKKRKANSGSDCEQEKRDISKWLSKKKTATIDPELRTSKDSKKSHRSKSPSVKSSKKSKTSKKLIDSKEDHSEMQAPTSENFDMPSKKELEEIRTKSKLKQKENEKLKAELDKMCATPPKKVENLSLQDMSLKDILNTFSTYKTELDEIYKKNCKRDYIKGHDGINHCFVIQLLQPNVQMKMLEKLTDIYSNNNNTMQATLYANALLPEWIIRVYMDKFNFTRQEAIDQIKAQDDYRLHMEEQNDGSFIFN